MKVFLEIIGALLLTLVAVFVDALGYQIFWNDIVLNVWEIFSAGTVPTTLTYGVCVAISVGIGLLRIGKREVKNKEYSKAMAESCGTIVTKLIWIGVTLLVVGIIF